MSSRRSGWRGGGTSSQREPRRTTSSPSAIICSRSSPSTQALGDNRPGGRPLQGGQGPRARGWPGQAPALQPHDQQDADPTRTDPRCRCPLRADRPQPGQDQGREAERGRAAAGAAERRAGPGPAAGSRRQSRAARHRDHGRWPARIRADAPAMARPRSAQRSLVVAASKTAAGVRQISLDPELVQLLREHKIASPWSQPDDFVFPGRFRDQPRDRNSVRTRVLYSAIERANEVLAAKTSHRCRTGSPSTRCAAPTLPSAQSLASTRRSPLPRWATAIRG